MSISRLKKAHHIAVEKWLTEVLQLTPYQKSMMIEKELIRWAPFDFYEDREPKKVSFLWRFTIIVFPVYWILLLIGMPIRMIVTGKWYYSQKFYDNFHSAWLRKLNL